METGLLLFSLTPTLGVITFSYFKSKPLSHNQLKGIVIKFTKLLPPKTLKKSKATGHPSPQNTHLKVNQSKPWTYYLKIEYRKITDLDRTFMTCEDLDSNLNNILYTQFSNQCT